MCVRTLQYVADDEMQTRFIRLKRALTIERNSKGKLNFHKLTTLYRVQKDKYLNPQHRT